MKARFEVIEYLLADEGWFGVIEYLLADEG